MDTRVRLRDHIREINLFSNRLLVAVVLIVIAFCALLARMVYLQVLNHDVYTTLSQNNRVTLVPLPPARGLIYDKNGVVLAQNLPSFTLEIVPDKVSDVKGVIAQLQQIITIDEADIAKFQKMRTKSSRFKSIPLRYRLNEEEVAAFYVRRHFFPGVSIEARLMRHYPFGTMAVHALGYVGRISETEVQDLDANYNGTTHIGKNGVEKSYEATLHGTVGYQKVETNAQGRTLRILEQQPFVPGENLYLHVNINVQAAAETALGTNRGAVVAVDPKTGGVIALASMPGFDPNPFVNGIETAEYTELANSRDQPLFNRALKGSYPPGSTLKPFVGLAGLENDVVHGGSSIYCPGYYTLRNDNRRYRDWKKQGHGEVNLLSAIRESCDVYFYDLALTLGIDRMYSFLKPFGFGRPTGIDVAGEVAGLLPSRQWKQQAKREAWYPGETLITGIGQGFNLASPVQLAVATAALANYGTYWKPKLGYATQDPTNMEMRLIPPEMSGSIPVVKKENWDYTIESMERVIHHERGTAKRLSIGAQFRMAGKTGTAQVFGLRQDQVYKAEEIDEYLRDHALFIAFAPVEDPRIAVAVLVENGGSGGSVAAPVARAVMDEYLLHSLAGTSYQKPAQIFIPVEPKVPAAAAPATAPFDPTGAAPEPVEEESSIPEREITEE